MVSSTFICSARPHAATPVQIPMSISFFDYEKGKFELFQLMDVKERASSILGRKTDIMTRDSLHKTLRRRIEAAAVRVF